MSPTRSFRSRCATLPGRRARHPADYRSGRRKPRVASGIRRRGGSDALVAATAPARRLAIEQDPLLRRTYESADCVIGVAPYVQEFLVRLSAARFETMSETAVHEVRPDRPVAAASGTVRLLYVGRIVRTKGLRDIISALDLVRDLDVMLDVVGDGNDREACELLARNSASTVASPSMASCRVGRSTRSTSAPTSSSSRATGSPAATSASRRWRSACRSSSAAWRPGCECRRLLRDPA